MPLLRCLVFLIASASFAQSPIELGLKGGLALTDAYLAAGHGEQAYYTKSSAKDYLIGPFVELRLLKGFSAEVDALYRPASLQFNGQIIPYFPSTNGRYPIWEIPILAKYRFPLFGIKPFIDGGVSLRTVAKVLSDDTSNHGITLGGGVDFKAGRLHFSPELRYTHWSAPCCNSGDNILQNNNQVELLFGVSF